MYGLPICYNFLSLELAKSKYVLTIHFLCVSGIQREHFGDFVCANCFSGDHFSVVSCRQNPVPVGMLLIHE